MRFARKVLVMGFCAAVLAIPAASQATGDKSADTTAASQPQTKAEVTRPPMEATLKASMPVPATTDPDYVIGPQDGLFINVWKEPEVSENTVVRNDGKISMPLLNDVEASGKTPMQLATVLEGKLKQYLSDPRVTVVVTRIDSKRIFLMGEIGHIGSIEMLPNMTALQAVAMGGGFSKFAHLKKIYILRNVDGKQVKIPFNYKAVVNGQMPEQNILLKPGDTIVVP